MPYARSRIVALALLALLCGAVVAPARAQRTVSFYAVDLDDAEAKRADEKLVRNVNRQLGAIDVTDVAGLRDTRLELELLPYEDVIEVLYRNDRSKPFLARATPYVYIVAELQGADLEVLATYTRRYDSEAAREAADRQGSDGTTYHSYFVVNKERFDEVVRPGSAERDDPTLPELMIYLRKLNRDSRPRFIYHSAFSTSSYFRPALFFREQRVFSDLGG